MAAATIAHVKLAELYRDVTGADADPRTLAAALRRMPKPRRRVVRRRLEGASFREIGQELGVSHGTARDSLERTLRAMQKRLEGLPRYHLVGRSRNAR